MAHSITRPAFIVVVVLLVVGAAVGAPAAAATTTNGLDTLSPDSETTDSTDDGDDGGDGMDDEDDSEDDDDTTDGTDDDTADDTTDEDTTDDGTGDGDGDESDDGDATDADGDESVDPKSTADEVSESVEETVDTIEDGAEDDAYADDQVLEETREDFGSLLHLEGARRASVGAFEFVGPFELGALAVADRPDADGSVDEALEDEVERDGVLAVGLRDDTVHTMERDAGDGVESTTGDDAGDDPEPPGPAGGAAVGLGAVATAAALRNGPVVVGSVASTSSGGWLSTLFEKVRPFWLPLRYSRFDDSDPLEHDARERVYDIVNESPGAYLSAVAEEAELPLSTARHHVRVLERERLVTGAKLHGKRRFYPAYAEGIELAAALDDESTASVIDAIARLGAASVSDLADELGRDPSTISHHLQRLESDDVIVRERDGRAVVNRLSPAARTALEPDSTAGTSEHSEAVAGGAD